MKNQAAVPGIAGKSKAEREPVAPRSGLLPERTTKIVIAALVLFTILFPQIIGSRYWLNVGTMILINVILVLGLNIMLGYAGLLNLGYASFAGLAAYSAAISMLKLDLNFWLAMGLGVGLAVLFGLGMALPTLKLNLIFLALVTLAFGEIFVLLVHNFRSLTNGGMGIAGIHRPSILGYTFTAPIPYYYFALVFAGILIFTVYRLEHSRFGRAFKYIREDELAAETVGIDTVRTKLLAFGIGAAYAGVGGVLLASHLTVIGPNSFGFAQSLFILIMVAVGGPGHLTGALVGAVAFTLLPEVLRGFMLYRMFVYGAAMALINVFRPMGLIPPPKMALTVESGAGIDYQPSLKENGSRSSSGAGSSGTILSVKNLSKHFAGVTAVDKVNLDIRTGELVSIIGPNGAGKTTLVNVLSGLLSPTAGSVEFKGGDLTRWRPNRRARAGIGRTFQKIRLFPNLSVMENVVSGRHLHIRAGLLASIFRTPSQRREESALVAAGAYWLRFVGEDLYEKRNEIIKNLPYGYQKRVEIARSLAQEPVMLILDEPAAGLNSGEKEHLSRLIKRIQGLGVTIILIEHDMQMVMSISDRIIVLDNGEKVAEGTEAEVRANTRVIEAYLGRETA
ncbi:MAG: branched-chain amino acid ABC transporter ATP-binding protein/permease [Firmicutes bacterium]|nr:branched-chain amino acid ABC transporter ATP-binding protein/permease [Bacillota bacterium]